MKDQKQKIEDGASNNENQKKNNNTKKIERTKEH